jgi:serine/threonine protein kinase
LTASELAELKTSAAEASKDPLVGTVFADKYEILSVLGKGGMSIVYKARHKFMDRIVAVKILLEHLVNDATAVGRFQQESKAASSLSHQNIVSVHDFGQTPGGQAYFVMDCLEGPSLSKIIEDGGRLEITRAVDIFCQICDGLEHAHRKGIIHRDLKPNNIVLLRQDDGTELVKIVDFGIAKIVSSDGTPQQRLTQTGEVFGSPFYMSPEQCQGLPLDNRADIYSLGCLMYEALSGFPPLMGDSFVNTALKHINDEPVDLTELVPSANIPEPIEGVVMECLEKAPKDRYPTAEAVRQALLDAALSAGVPGLRAGAVKVPDSASPMRATWEKLTAGFTGAGTNKRKRKRLTPLQVSLMVGPTALLGTSLAFMLLWPGPVTDQGTVFNKLRWQLDMAAADDAIQKRNFEEAARLLSEGRNIAQSKFRDGGGRLRSTLERLVLVYSQLGYDGPLADVNSEILKIGQAQTDDDLSRVINLLEIMKTKSRSNHGVSLADAQANALLVIGLAQRLHGAQRYDKEEDLLRQTLITFTELRLPENAQTADLKTALAFCLAKQQKNFDEARTLLVDAKRIRQMLAQIDPQSTNLPDINVTDDQSRTAANKLIRAYLNLGQYDRDQSDYKTARQELCVARTLTDKYFANDKNLSEEVHNSIANLDRQMNKTAE